MITRPVILGGTFDPLHDGHRALFKKAFELSGNILIGLTGDNLAKTERARPVTPYRRRKLRLALYLKRTFPGRHFEIHEMTEVFNRPIISEIPSGILVVSEGTERVGRSINRKRVRNGLEPFELVTVPYVRAVDGLPITATRVMEGELDIHGDLLRPPLIAVGSMNGVKLDAVRTAFKKIFGKAIVKGFDVDPGVPCQPKGAETIKGAKNRAVQARNAWPNKKGPHFAVGLEAGLFRTPVVKRYMDVQYCAVLDAGGHLTYGHSAGFYYPSSFDKKIEEGMEIEDIIEQFFHIKNIGEGKGAIGFLTDNTVTRKDLLVSSVLMAMVPRLKRELYLSKV